MNGMSSQSSGPSKAAQRSTGVLGGGRVSPRPQGADAGGNKGRCLRTGQQQADTQLLTSLQLTSLLRFDEHWDAHILTQVK